MSLTLEQRIRNFADTGDKQAGEVVDLLDGRDNRISNLVDILQEMFTDPNREYNFNGYFQYQFNAQDLIKIANVLQRETGHKYRVNPGNANIPWIESLMGE